MKDPILGMAFAVADATDQAGMIDAMARQLFVVCGGRFSRSSPMSGYEPQCCALAAKLGKDGIQLIKDLHAFIELREKEMG